MDYGASHLCHQWCNVKLEIDDRPFNLIVVDFFVNIVDPMKELPLIKANIVLSILLVKYTKYHAMCSSVNN